MNNLKMKISKQFDLQEYQKEQSNDKFNIRSKKFILPNYKTLKEIKADINKWEGIPCSCTYIRKFNIC